MVPTTIGNNQQTNDGAASAGRGAGNSGRGRSAGVSAGAGAGAGASSSAAAAAAARDAILVALVALCNFVPTAEVIEGFKRAAGCAHGASLVDVEKAYKKAALRSSANGNHEFRHEDKGGDQAKAAFLLRSTERLFGTELEHEDWRAAYDGLCARLVRPRPDTPAELGAGADGAPFREDICSVVDLFRRANDGYSGRGVEVSPVTRRTVHSSDVFGAAAAPGGGGAAAPTHSGRIVQAGAGEQHRTHPWRGDVVVETKVSPTLDCTINGTDCTMSRRTLDWDLQVEHTLSSFEACTGSATLNLEHPNGFTYRMVLTGRDSGAGADDVFVTGMHVRCCVGLGAPTSTGGFGDLYIVLHSDLENDD